MRFSILHTYCILFGLVCISFLSCKSFTIKRGEKPMEILSRGESGKYFIIADTNGRQYLLDTGSSDSYLDENIINSLKKNDYQSKSLKATINQIEGFKSEKVETLDFASFTIKHSRFTHFPSNSPIRKISKNIEGILGMNILGQKVSYWNIQQNIFILGYKPQEVEQPVLTLRYQDQNRIPTVNITINNLQYGSVLLDTGYYNFLRLQSSNTLSFDSESFVSQNNDILGNNVQMTTYNTNSINLNGYQLKGDNFRISLGNFDRDLLGYNFFAYWDYFVLDPFEKEFRFYKK